jgi:hypothetical protein
LWADVLVFVPACFRFRFRFRFAAAAAAAASSIFINSVWFIARDSYS